MPPRKDTWKSRKVPEEKKMKKKKKEKEKEKEKKRENMEGEHKKGHPLNHEIRA